MVKVSMVRIPAGLEDEVTGPSFMSANCRCSGGNAMTKARCEPIHLLGGGRTGPTEETEEGTGAETEA